MFGRWGSLSWLHLVPPLPCNGILPSVTGKDRFQFSGLLFKKSFTGKVVFVCLLSNSNKTPVPEVSMALRSEWVLSIHLASLNVWLYIRLQVTRLEVPLSGGIGKHDRSKREIVTQKCLKVRNTLNVFQRSPRRSRKVWNPLLTQTSWNVHVQTS